MTDDIDPIMCKECAAGDIPCRGKIIVLFRVSKEADVKSVLELLRIDTPTYKYEERGRVIKKITALDIVAEQQKKYKPFKMQSLLARVKYRRLEHHVDSTGVPVWQRRENLDKIEIYLKISDLLDERGVARSWRVPFVNTCYNAFEPYHFHVMACAVNETIQLPVVLNEMIAEYASWDLETDDHLPIFRFILDQKKLPNVLLRNQKRSITLQEKEAQEAEHQEKREKRKAILIKRDEHLKKIR